MKINTGILIILSTLFFSCTHNNGDIGNLFGKWQLKETRQNGEQNIHDDIFYNFQSNVVSVQHIYPGHAVTKAYGYFTHLQDSLQISLQDITPEQALSYELPDTMVGFAIKELTIKKMILEKEGKEWFLKKY